MSPATALHLARPAGGADRGRAVLVALATALAGALLIAAVRVARMNGQGDDAAQIQAAGELARFVTEPGLRPGYLTAIALVTVPVLALALQALRVGSTARDRRMASLRLAGATPADVRAVAAVEAGGAALLGGLLSGPLYVLLWLAVGVAPRTGFRLLPLPTPTDAAVWAGVVLLTALSGAAAGALVDGRAVAEPLGVHRRTSTSRPGRLNLATLTVAVLCVVAATAWLEQATFTVVSMAGLLVAAFAGGPRLVMLVGELLRRRGGARALMAGGRLLADPRSGGRVAGVLVVCGLALAIDATLVAAYLGDDTSYRSTDDDAFYLGGFALGAAAIAVGAGVALVTLVVGAVDALLDAKRPLATLSAVGVDASFLTRVLGLQLAAVAVPAVMAGTLAGFAVAASPLEIDRISGAVLLGVAGVTAAAGAVTLAAALLVARALRRRVRAAIDPENLRLA